MPSLSPNDLSNVDRQCSGDQLSERIRKRVAEKLFAQRKGHGGAPISFLNLRESDLAALVSESINLYRKVS